MSTPMPMRIRAQLKGDVTEIRILVNHPMETGQRKNADGSAIPRHAIQELTVSVGGKTVVETQAGTSLSRDPFLGFKVKGAKVGDKVVVTWRDDQGQTRTDEAAVS